MLCRCTTSGRKSRRTVAIPAAADRDQSRRPAPSSLPASDAGGGSKSTWVGKVRSYSLGRFSGCCIAKKATAWPDASCIPATSSMYPSAPPRRYRNLLTWRIRTSPGPLLGPGTLRARPQSSGGARVPPDGGVASARSLGGRTMAGSRGDDRIRSAARAALAVLYGALALGFWAVVAIAAFGALRLGAATAAGWFAIQMVVATAFLLLAPRARALTPPAPPGGGAPDRPRAAVGA